MTADENEKTTTTATNQDPEPTAAPRPITLAPTGRWLPSDCPDSVLAQDLAWFPAHPTEHRRDRPLTDEEWAQEPLQALGEKLGLERQAAWVRVKHEARGRGHMSRELLRASFLTESAAMAVKRAFTKGVLPGVVTTLYAAAAADEDDEDDAEFAALRQDLAVLRERMRRNKATLLALDLRIKVLEAERQAAGEAAPTAPASPSIPTATPTATISDGDSPQEDAAYAKRKYHRR